MDSGLEFLAVIAGGGVVTFVAVAILEMIKKGRALRARPTIEEERTAQRLDSGAAPPFSDAVREPTIAQREDRRDS